MRLLRTYSGLTREEFGVLFHSKESTVSSWECGRAVPRLHKLIRISDYFNVSLDCILSGRAITENTLETRIASMEAPVLPGIPSHHTSQFIARINLLPSNHRERLIGYFDALCREAGV